MTDMMDQIESLWNTTHRDDLEARIEFQKWRSDVNHDRRTLARERKRFEQGIDEINTMLDGAQICAAGGLEDGSYDNPAEFFLGQTTRQITTFQFTINGPTVYVECEHDLVDGHQEIYYMTAIASTDGADVRESIDRDTHLYALVESLLPNTTIRKVNQ